MKMKFKVGDSVYLNLPGLMDKTYFVTGYLNPEKQELWPRSESPIVRCFRDDKFFDFPESLLSLQE